MCDAWHASMDCGDVSAVVFLDIRKAFDSISHNVLLRKMEEQFGVSNVGLHLTFLIGNRRVLSMARCQHLKK